MNVQIVENKTTWDDFFNANSSPSFLQSWSWGEMEVSLGEKILRLGIYDPFDKTQGHPDRSRTDGENKLVGIALVLIIKAKRGNFILIPHGPIIEAQMSKLKAQNCLKTLKDYLIPVAKENQCLFIRISPVLENTEENRNIFSELGFKTAPIYLHAETVWVLDLVTNSSRSFQVGKTELEFKTDDQLLSEMRKTTRYLIRKAIKDGITIEKSTKEETVEDFWQLYQETAKRERFTPFPKDFISQEFKAFHKTSDAIYLIGKYQGKMLASALVIFTRSTGFYHQGASIHTKEPVPYLLQWEAIKEAKKRGCRLYNFWGILQPGRTPKAWTGLTLFKQGFGGRQVDYVLTQDYVLSPKYYLTYVYEKYLTLRRGI